MSITATPGIPREEAASLAELLFARLQVGTLSFSDLAHAIDNYSQAAFFKGIADSADLCDRRKAEYLAKGDGVAAEAADLCAWSVRASVSGLGAKTEFWPSGFTEQMPAVPDARIG